MKRIFSFIALASLILVACGKEEALNENEPINEQPQNGTVTLTAVMPSFVSDTKAGVASDGTFSWTVGDLIDVVYTDGESTKAIQFSCSSINSVAGDDYGEGTFVNVDKEGNEIPSGYHIKTDGNIAFYPTGYNGTPSNQTFSTKEDAAKGFQMHATYDNGKIQFEHDNAILILTITNLPYFAKQIVAGGAAVNVSNTSDQATETIYLPVMAAAAAKLSIAVKDKTSAGNDIISKSTKNSVEIKKGYIYTSIPTLPIGPYVAFEGSSNSSHKIGLMGKNLDGTTSASWGSYSLQSNGTTKYNMLGGDYLKAPALQIELRQNDGGDEYAKSTTVFVVNDRNFKFDVSESSMKTDYRVYFNNATKSWSTVKVFAWRDTGFYIYCTDTTPYVNYWLGDTAASGWVAKTEDRYDGAGKKYYYYNISNSKLQATLTALQIGFSDGWYYQHNTVDTKNLNRFYWYYNKEKTSDLEYTEETENKTLTDGWPGNSVSLVSGVGYYEVASSYYGKAISCHFHNGANYDEKTRVWHLNMNRDYYVSE